VTVGIGLWFSKRSSSNIEEYFVAGRALPWWLAGTSLAATYFATDAPLLAASLVRQHGIFANWLWWYEATGVMVIVFFYAKLWRRANIVTDAEFIELRYSGRAATALRTFTALYHGVIKNLVVMGFVLLAMMKFSQIMFGFDPLYTLIVCVCVALVYTVTAGLWGVVVTDLFQFITGTLGTMIFAGLVLYELGGPAEMAAQIASIEGGNPGTLDLVPDSDNISSLQFVSYIALIFILWVRSAQGDGYLAQRLFATKDEKQSVLAALWFNFAANVMITWPWIVVGLGSLIMFPIATATPELLADPELAYPMMIDRVVPVGLKGIVIASFLAAFMSTMDTHLCWGGSYMVSDIYKRFLKKDASDRHYVAVSRASILVLAALAAVTAWLMESIESGWIYILEITAGLAIVNLLRWYWWRVNAWAEISAMAGTLVLANGGLLARLFAGLGLMSDATAATFAKYYTSDYDMLRATFILVSCTVLWLIVAMLTKPVDLDHLEAFYRRVRPSGWWGEVARRCPDVVVQNTTARSWLGWFFGIIFIYASLLGIGYTLTGHGSLGVLLIAISMVGAVLTVRIARQNIAQELAGSAASGPPDAVGDAMRRAFENG
jgi:SSS family solute:Na+ symporter